MRCFARLMRWAIVASGTRNALAISAVVSPPTARRVSAMADGRVSAGWQHMNSRMSESSCSGAAVGARTEARARPVRPRRVLHHDDGLAPPPRQLGAELVGHAPGGDLDQPAARVVRHALGRPLHRRRDQRLLHGVFGGREVAEAPDDGAEHLRRQLAQQVLASEGHAAVRGPTGGAAHHLAHLDWHVHRHAAFAGRRRRARRDRVGPLRASRTSTIQ